MFFDIAAPHVELLHVPIDTPSDIVERGDTAVSAIVTVPVVATEKELTEDPPCATVPEKVSVVVVGLGVVVLEVLLLLQLAAAAAAAATKADAISNRMFGERRIICPSDTAVSRRLRSG